MSSSIFPCPRVLTSLILFLAIDARIPARAREPIAPTTTEIAELLREYQADVNCLGRSFELPASEATLDRVAKLADGWLVRLDRFDFDALNAQGRVDFLLLKSEIRRSLQETARSRKHLAEIAPSITFRTIIHELETARWQASPLDCQAAATRVTALAEQVKQLHEHPPKPDGKPIAATDAVRAAAKTHELQETLKRWYAFHDGYRPDFSWWLKKPYEEATKQMEDYAKYLREEVAQIKGKDKDKDDDRLLGEPIGPEALATDIRGEWLPYTADELIAIGEREFAWCERQMKAASREMKLGDDWKAALARVKADYVPPGEQDELVARLAHEATEFVKQRKLVAVPPLCEESWRLSMLSPEAMKTISYAAYSGRDILVAYSSSEMKQDDKLMVMRGNNRHFTRLVIPHELIPGHHLQCYYEARSPERVLPTSFYVEGWAFYWELRLWDLNWATTPEDRIGMLFWRMTRSARVILTLKYHLGRMTPDEMVSFLMDRVGHEKFGARSEVRRFIQDRPLYQVGYLIGGRQILALHDEMVGGALTEPRFHEAVLKQGVMPIELLRAAMQGIELKKDAGPTWHFDKAVE